MWSGRTHWFLLSVPAGYKDGKYYIKVYADDGVADSYGSTAAP